MKIRLFIFFVIIGSLLIGCDQPLAPKPRGYLRIDLPQKDYVKFDTTFPFSFEYPSYAVLTNDPLSPTEKYWLNMNFPSFKATLHLSYKPVDDNLIVYLEDAHKMVTKHIPKADAIYDSLIVDRKNNKFGLIYELTGSGAASPCQFFLTDSTSHFVRGALYFNIVPNNDSLAPVIEFISEDIDHMINTFEWK